jgi:SOS-response transcriptional repressor LexA
MGIVFPGRSGAGKTTLADKVRNPEDVLSDELVPVTRDEAGRWRAHPSPFWGGGRRGGTSLRSWPLASIAFVRKDRTLSVSKVSPAEAAQRLLQTVLCLERDPATATDLLALAARLCSDVPAVEIGSALETPATDMLGSVAHSRPLASASPARETISEARSILRSGRPYVFVAKGTSMHPQLRAGDELLVEPTRREDLEPGDLVLYWRPAATPEDDLLVCHRLVARARREGEARVVTKGDRAAGVERFVDRREAEILGRVVSVTRAGRARRLPGRLVKWSRLAASLAGAWPALRG